MILSQRGNSTVVTKNVVKPVLTEPTKTIVSKTGGSPGQNGPPGPLGPAGPPGGMVTAIAAVVIQAYRVVAMDATGKAYLADPSILTDSCFVVGISTVAALVGEAVIIQTDGLLSTPALWSPGPLFLGTGGILIASPPVSGYQLQIAVAATTTQLIVRPQLPIFI